MAYTSYDTAYSGYPSSWRVGDQPRQAVAPNASDPYPMRKQFGTTRRPTATRTPPVVDTRGALPNPFPTSSPDPIDPYQLQAVAFGTATNRPQTGGPDPFASPYAPSGPPTIPMNPPPQPGPMPIYPNPPEPTFSQPVTGFVPPYQPPSSMPTGNPFDVPGNAWGPQTFNQNDPRRSRDPIVAPAPSGWLNDPDWRRISWLLRARDEQRAREREQSAREQWAQQEAATRALMPY